MESVLLKNMLELKINRHNNALKVRTFAVPYSCAFGFSSSNCELAAHCAARRLWWIRKQFHRLRLLKYVVFS